MISAGQRELEMTETGTLDKKQEQVGEIFASLWGDTAPYTFNEKALKISAGKYLLFHRLYLSAHIRYRLLARIGMEIMILISQFCQGTVLWFKFG